MVLKDIQPARYGFEQIFFIETNLIDLSDPISSKDTKIDHDDFLVEVEVVRKKVAEEGAKCLHLEKK